jgi:hypothetical protein
VREFLLVGELREANRRPANQSGYNAVHSNQPIRYAFLSELQDEGPNLTTVSEPQQLQTWLTELIVDCRKFVATH